MTKGVSWTTASMTPTFRYGAAGGRGCGDGGVLWDRLAPPGVFPASDALLPINKEGTATSIFLIFGQYVTHLLRLRR